MNIPDIRNACLALGYEEPISIEPDGTVWLGLDDERTYPDMKPIMAKVAEMAKARESARQTALGKLAALGLTEAEIQALVG